jgi:hypothetical protein
MITPNIVGAQVYIRGCVEIGEVQSMDTDEKFGPMAYVQFERTATGRWWPVTDVMLVEEPKQ